jgi:murein DD-endopeptidase MepM/ murein hydrolase activator NlpD
VKLAGTTVSAPEDGIVKKRETTSNGGWHGYIVMEHNHPTGKFTTVYWHIDPVSGIAVGDFVPKGMQIATVANMGGNTHFHMGLRLGAYDGSPTAYAGALPQSACTDPSTGTRYLAHPASFIDVEKTPVLFQ